MKKILGSLMIFLILFNFICINPIYAVEESGNSFDQSEIDQMMNEGTASVNGENTSVSVGDVVIGTIIGTISKIINGIPMIAHFLATVVLQSGGIIEDNCTEEDIGLFNIQNIIIGKYLILDVNVFRDLSEGISNDGFGSYVDTLKEFKKTVAMWFVIIRDIAIAINLVMLLYIAIRMAISTIASDKAKYKELLFNWVVSMILLFILPQMMAVINTVSDILVDISRNIMISLEASNRTSFENEILSSMYSLIAEHGGMKMALYSIIYWVVMWNEIKFFLLYSKRMLSVHFLVVISPLITVTYAADKIADKKAQAYDRWFKEYTTNVFVQPIHCFVYMVFMYMANNIAVQAPLVGVIFLMSLTRAEKLVKSLIAFSSVSIKGIGENGPTAKGLGGSLKGLVPKPSGKS